MQRVFISFDYDNDSDLKNALVGQARYPNSPFQIADWSVKEPLSGNWQAKVAERMKRTSVVAVMCGHRTHTARGVAAEVRIAQQLRKPYFLLAGRSQGNNTKPTTATQRDKMYRWTWDNLNRSQGEMRRSRG